MLKKCGLFILMTSSLNAFSQDCQIIKDPKVPYCPEGRAVMLDDRYPSNSYVVSSQLKKDNYRVSTEIITKILKAHAKNPNRKQVVISVPGDEKAFNAIMARLSLTSDQEVKALLGQVKHVPLPGITFERDMRFSVFGPGGHPIIRENAPVISRNKNVQDIKVHLAKAKGASFGNCVMNGAELEDDPSNQANHSKRIGNMVALPGGGCIVHQRGSEKFFSQLCDPSKVVTYPVDHFPGQEMDNLIKVLPLNPAREPLECSFKVMIPSPKKGLELLEKNKTNEDYFFESHVTDMKEREKFFQNIKEGNSTVSLCQLLRKIKNPIKNNPQNQIPKENKSESKSSFIWRMLDQFNIQKVYADASSIYDWVGCLDKLMNVKTRDMHELMSQDNELKGYISFIQENRFDKLKQDVVNNISKSLPQCNVEVLEMPELFIGNSLNSLKSMDSAINSLVANDTLIIPEISNSVFKKAVEDEIKNKTGLNVESVNTRREPYDVNQGILAVTNSFPHCRPKEVNMVMSW